VRLGPSDVSPRFAEGKWAGVWPEVLEFGDVVYLARRSHNRSDREIAQQELMRRLRAAKKRRFYGSRPVYPKWDVRGVHV